jgi:hypothetical protein
LLRLNSLIAIAFLSSVSSAALATQADPQFAPDFIAKNNGVSHVPSLAALRDLIPPTASAIVIRDDYASGYGAPSLTYKWKAACPGTPDNLALYVAPSAGGAGCWSAATDPNVWQITEWGVTFAMSDAGPTINQVLAAAKTLSQLDVTVYGGQINLQTSVSIPSGVHLHGQGGAPYSVCGTVAVWTGTPGGTMFSTVAAPGTEMANPGLADMCIYANNVAGVGINKKGVTSGQFKRLVITNATQYGVDEGINPSSPIASDVMSNWEDIQVICQTGTTCWHTSGNNTWDTAHNTYKNVNIQHYGTAIGFDCGASDKNDFIDLYINSIGGSGYSFIAEAGTSNTPAPNGCNEHHFSGVTVMEGGMHFVGNGSFSAWGSSIDAYGLGDGEPQPVVDTGASLSWTDTKGQIHNILQGVGYGAGGLALGAAPTFEATLEVGACVASNVSCAKFGPTLPLYITADNPGFGFNQYWTGSSWYYGDGSSNNWSAAFQFNTSTGQLSFAPSTTAGNAGAVATNAVAVGFSKSAEIILAKETASGAAPGTGLLKFQVVAGTTGGTCKIIAYAGTSTTPVTIVDNVGGGC